MQEVEQKKQNFSQIEDSAMKTMVRFFADEMLPYFGIEGNVKSIAPTEEIHIEIKKLYEDMNLVMEDGTWKHFEFQSTNGGVKDLKRFRVYEAVTSQENNVTVVTYVLFSGKIKNPKYQFTEGINTYRVIPIVMKNENADRIVNKLMKKQQKGKPIKRCDLVMLALTPLMEGKISIKDRIKKAFQIVSREICMKTDEIQKLQAVIYAFAEKFLESEEMNEIKGEINMTKLGQMLVNDGKSMGKAEAIIDFLDAKGLITDDLRKKINEEQNIDILTKWIKVVATSNTMEEIKKQIVL